MIGETAKRQLKERINRELLSRLRSPVPRGGSPHERVTCHGKVQAASRKLLSALQAYPGLERALAYELDRIYDKPKQPASLDALRAELPELDEGALLFLEGLVIVPSREAKAWVEQTRRAVDCLRLLAEFAERTQRAAVAQGQPKHEADHDRYLLIVELAGIYHSIFKLEPSANLEGPWCLFLAEVLTRCGSKKLSNSGAYRIWLKVRKWWCGDNLLKEMGGKLNARSERASRGDYSMVK